MRLLRKAIWTLVILFVLLNTLAIFHACKFTYFYNNGKATIKKPEQLSTWEKTKVLLLGVQNPKSVNKAVPRIPYDTVSLLTEDQLRLRGWYMRNKEARGTVILFHGHGSSGAGILEEAYYMHSLGYHTLVIDFRAHGNSEGNVCTIGYFEAADVKAAYDYIRKKVKRTLYCGACHWARPLLPVPLRNMG
ncbi:alpha/beta hydrolase [Paraflavitalea speifideaquila]|uniref:alpha/beta hydrolase n=1 Tax=Paraflavitalea speifideaquila TaxID=3076558 RepID=UPI0028EE6325|nr:alpha/beta hydrolase [Paraflavitalea speifideiaquila]